MLTREIFILPESLQVSRATGVLDSCDRVREATREYLSFVESGNEELRDGWRRGMENYAKNPVRFAA